MLLVLAVPIGVGLLSTEGDIKAIETRVPFHKAVGQVAHLDCDDHNYYYVSYELNSYSYTGMARYYADQNRDCSELRVNDRIELWYSERDPHFMTMIPPQDALGNLRSEFRISVTIGTIVALMMIGLAAIGVCSRSLRRMR